MSPEDIKVREAYMSDITVNLIINYGWGVQEIEAYMQEHGEKGLIAKYKALEKKTK